MEAKPNDILLCMQYLMDHLDGSFGSLGFTRAGLAAGLREVTLKKEYWHEHLVSLKCCVSKNQLSFAGTHSYTH